MKNRILNNWTVTRALYLIMGIVLIVHSIMNQQWLGIAFGSYFASMGLFAFGCAAGNCAPDTKQNSNKSIQDVEFEEVKTK